MTPAAQLRSDRHTSCKGEGESTSFKLPCSVLFAHQQCNFILNPFLRALQTMLAFTVVLQSKALSYIVIGISFWLRSFRERVL